MTENTQSTTSNETSSTVDNAGTPDPLGPSPIEELIGKPLDQMNEDELREHVQNLREARSVPSKMKSLLSAEKRQKSAGEKKRAKEDKARRDASSILKELDLGID